MTMIKDPISLSIYKLFESYQFETSFLFVNSNLPKLQVNSYRNKKYNIEIRKKYQWFAL